jgi:hypothetical protein
MHTYATSSVIPVEEAGTACAVAACSCVWCRGGQVTTDRSPTPVAAGVPGTGIDICSGKQELATGAAIISMLLN